MNKQPPCLVNFSSTNHYQQELRPNMTDARSEEDGISKISINDIPETTSATKTKKTVKSSKSKKKKGTVIKMGAQSVSAFGGGGRPMSSGAAPWERGQARDNKSINSALVDSMEIPRDRLLVFKIEQNLTKFMLKKEKKTMKFPPLDGNARRLLHLMCERFQLTSETIETGDYDVKTPKSMRIHKERHSILPEVQLIEKFGREASSGPKHKLMLRKRGDVPIGYTSSGNKDKRSGSNLTEKSNAERLKEKELKYAEAKKRIFADEKIKKKNGIDGGSDDVVSGSTQLGSFDPTLTGGNTTGSVSDRVVSSSDRPHNPVVSNELKDINDVTGDTNWRTPPISPVGASTNRTIHERTTNSPEDQAAAVVAAAVAGAAVNDDGNDMKGHSSSIEDSSNVDIDVGGIRSSSTDSTSSSTIIEEKQTVFHKWRKDPSGSSSNFRDHDHDAYDPDFNRGISGGIGIGSGIGSSIGSSIGGGMGSNIMLPGLQFGAIHGVAQSFGAFQAWGAPQPFMGQQHQQVYSQQPYPSMATSNGMNMQQQQQQQQSLMNQMAWNQGMQSWNQQGGCQQNQ